MTRCERPAVTCPAGDSHRVPDAAQMRALPGSWCYRFHAATAGTSGGNKVGLRGRTRPGSALASMRATSDRGGAQPAVARPMLRRGEAAVHNLIRVTRHCVWAHTHTDPAVPVPAGAMNCVTYYLTFDVRSRSRTRDGAMHVCPAPGSLSLMANKTPVWAIACFVTTERVRRIRCRSLWSFASSIEMGLDLLALRQKL